MKLFLILLQKLGQSKIFCIEH